MAEAGTGFGMEVTESPVGSQGAGNAVPAGQGDDITIEEGAEPNEPEEEEEEGPKIEHLKTRHIPAVVMLLGGAATAVSCFVRGYPLMRMLLLVFLSLLFFWIMGSVIRLLLDKIVIVREEPAIEDEEEGETKDGEVIDKTGQEG